LNRFAMMYFDARVGAHPSDFCSGKSHQNHSLQDAILRIPCVPRGLRREKNSRSPITQTPFRLFRSPLRYSVSSSRSWRPFQSFHRNPHRERIVRREGSVPTDAVTKSGVSSLLTRRASQSLTGGKRGVSERSELASAWQGQEAQRSRRPR
jgi:hypothetical protein